MEVPVIGSGDVYTPHDALRMRQETGAAAVFAARGARGNPWIFSGITPTPLQRVQAAQRHLELYLQFYGGEHLSPLRAQLAFYVHGQAGAAELRRALGSAVTAGEFSAVLASAAQRCASGGQL